MGRAVEERERELVRSERLAAVGKMAAMITHEVRNPLSSIGLNTELIEEEVSRGTYDPPVEPRTLGYAIVRLAEAFLFNDAANGLRGELDRLRDVERALLGVR